MRSFLVAGLLLALLAIRPIASAATEDGSRKRAAYFLDNDPAGNTIVSLKISEKDGLLSSPIRRTPTGGKGLLGLNASGLSAGPDALFGQDVVVVKDDYLFAANPGSNTLSMFHIDEENPTHLTLVGKPADTLGEFPTSVAYSSKLKIACVLNGGEVGGVTCFLVDHAKGLIPLDKSPRPISQALPRTTPPTGPPATVSDLLFNPTSTALFAIIKGNPRTTPPTPGYFYAWPVESGKVSWDPIVSSVSDIVLQFGSAFLGDDSRFVVSDPVYGAAIVAVSPSFQITEETHIVIPYQAAACWAVYSESFDSIYIVDALRTNITVLDPRSGSIKGLINYSQSAGGGTDSAVDRSWLYVLAFDASIVVIDLQSSTPSEVQKLDLSWLGNRIGWQGMAIYPSV